MLDRSFLWGDIQDEKQVKNRSVGSKNQMDEFVLLDEFLL